MEQLLGDCHGTLRVVAVAQSTVTGGLAATIAAIVWVLLRAWSEHDAGSSGPG